MMMAAPALSRVLVDAELMLAENSALGIPYNPEIENELKHESIDVDGVTKPLYQFMGEFFSLCFVNCLWSEINFYAARSRISCALEW